MAKIQFYEDYDMIDLDKLLEYAKTDEKSRKILERREFDYFYSVQNYIKESGAKLFLVETSNLVDLVKNPSLHELFVKMARTPFTDIVHSEYFADFLLNYYGDLEECSPAYVNNVTQNLIW